MGNPNRPSSANAGPSFRPALSPVGYERDRKLGGFVIALKGPEAIEAFLDESEGAAKEEMLVDVDQGSEK